MFVCKNVVLIFMEKISREIVDVFSLKEDINWEKYPVGIPDHLNFTIAPGKKKCDRIRKTFKNS